AIVLTVSRGGLVAAGVGVLAFYALAPDRLPKLAAGLPAAVGSAIVVRALVAHVALRDGLSTPQAVVERHQLTFLVLAVCTAVAAAQVMVDLAERRIIRPRALWISRRRGRWLTAAALVLALVGAAALSVPGRLVQESKVFRQQVHSSVG